MSNTSNQPRQTNDPTTYAPLRSSSAAEQPDSQRAPAAAPSASPSAFSAEFAKLQELREALWEAFKAGPDAGLPTMLIDLTNCYTNTLRFQMNMKCLNQRKPTSQPQQNPTAKK